MIVDNKKITKNFYYMNYMNNELFSNKIKLNVIFQKSILCSR